MANPVTSSSLIRLTDKWLREVFDGAYAELPSYKEKLFRVIESDRAKEEFWGITGLPDFQAFSGKLAYAPIYPSFYTRIEPKEFALGVAFERKLLDDKLFDVLEDAVAELGVAAARTQNKSEVEPFANGFSSAFSFMQSEEGVPLFSASHKNKTGASTAVGFSNIGSSAFSKTAVSAARIIMRQFRSDIGERIDTNPDTLIVPSGVADTAWELVHTPYGYETSAHTVSVEGHRGWKVIELPRLDDTDTNNWFMVDSRLMKKFLIWIDRIKPTFERTKDFETFELKYAGYMRYAWGFTNWRFAFGSQVS